jgi:4-amino-4-deoxychorismate lyase
MRLSYQPKLAGIKHLNRLENVMARMEWQEDTIFDGLLLDQQGNVIECTMSNVFARFDQTLITPDLGQCGVMGVTRQRIIGLAAMLKMNIEVGEISMDRLLQADEVIVCNSLYGAFQVAKIADTTWSQQALAKTIRSALNT